MKVGVHRSACVLMSAVLLVSCSPNKSERTTEPLPTRAVTDLVCGFVSRDSAEIVLGAADILANGSKVDLPGVNRNADGSTLNLAGCDLLAKGDRILIVSVAKIGRPPYSENDVPAVLASGGADFVFPAAEGQGYARAGRQGEPAASAQLVRGDWLYAVSITNPGEGRKAVDDAVALIRQVVAQLGLPRVETLPRPSVTSTS